MNRIDELFKKKKGNILSVYFTAGYPFPDSTVEIIKTLAEAGVDMVEIGMPFSDPMADGPVIQKSNQAALKNGMSLNVLFNQLQNIREKAGIPLILMGYLNPVLQYGVENFCRQCQITGIDGIILPDLPLSVYIKEYQSVFEKFGLYNILLISPQSDNERVKEIDRISRGFIYLVSSSSVTGVKGNFSEKQFSYFSRVKNLGLKNPGLIGFGISNHVAFREACKYARGGIIGSAFVNVLGMDGDFTENIKKFVKEIRG